VLPFFANLPVCEIAMEACAGAHYWAREFSKFEHEVKLIAPQFVKPYVKTNKNDAADAEAICEAMSRPGMRFVPIKTATQQASLSECASHARGACGRAYGTRESHPSTAG
jgi:transposase